MKQSIQILLLCIILFIVTLGAYYPAWNGTPIWDDDHHITRPELRSLDGLGRIWTRAWRHRSSIILSFIVYSARISSLGRLSSWLSSTEHFTPYFISVFISKNFTVSEIPALGLPRLFLPYIPSRWNRLPGYRTKNTLSGSFPFHGFHISEIQPKWKKSALFFFRRTFLFLLAVEIRNCDITSVALAIFWWQRGKINGTGLWFLIPFFIIGLSSGVFTSWVERKLSALKEGNLTFLYRTVL